jgi:hypothetical protein
VKARCTTPQPTPSPWDEASDDVSNIASETDPTRSQQKRLKYLCLKRDNFRCLVTGIVETEIEGPQSSGDVADGETEVAHILPFSIGAWRHKDGVCDSLSQYDANTNSLCLGAQGRANLGHAETSFSNRPQANRDQ